MGERYITDRTAITTDWECGMRYWWMREHGGTGIVPTKTAEYLTDGIDIHEDFAFLNEGGEWAVLRDRLDALRPDTLDELERWTRRYAWAVSYHHYVLPYIKTHFEIIATEEELILDRDPLWIATTVDLLLQSKKTGQLALWDFKTAKWFGMGWDQHWAHNVQLNILMAAVEEEYGIPVSHATVLGVGKGEYKKGRLAHPYVYGYRNPHRLSEWQVGWKRGWEQVGAWNYPIGIAGWVEECGRDHAMEKVFRFSSPCFLNTRLLERMVDRRLEREEEIEKVREECHTDLDLRALAFEQRFTKCVPMIGAPCPYRSACFNKAIADDPIGSGEYVARVPHHEVEIQAREEE